MLRAAQLGETAIQATNQRHPPTRHPDPAQGRRLLRLWFLRPLVNLEVLGDRHDTIQLLMRAPELMKTLRDVMARVRDLPKLLARLQLTQGRPELACFAQLHESLSNLLVLRDVFGSLAPRLAEGEGAVRGRRLLCRCLLLACAPRPALLRAQPP